MVYVSSLQDQFVYIGTWLFGALQPTAKILLSCWMLCPVLRV